MLSQTAEYALRAIVWLAAHSDTPLATQQIAKAIQVPESYLSKVLQTLGRANMVVSQRGLHGGFRLNIAPEKTNILDVVNAVDPMRRSWSCPLGSQSHGACLCPLHRQLDRATSEVEKVFSETTITQLVSENVQPRCK